MLFVVDIGKHCVLRINRENHSLIDLPETEGTDVDIVGYYESTRHHESIKCPCFTMIISCFLVEILVKSKAYAEGITPSLSSKATNTILKYNFGHKCVRSRSTHKISTHVSNGSRHSCIPLSNFFPRSGRRRTPTKVGV